MPLWDVYSYFYGFSLTNLFPYRHLLDDLVGALDLGEGNTVLDAGCGPGLVVSRILDQSRGRGISVTGVDFSPAMIRHARRRCRDYAAAEFKVADLNRNLEFSHESFDRIVCSNTLYALESPLRTVFELHRVLKHGGLLVVANPKPNAGQRPLMRDHVNTIRKLAPAHTRIYWVLRTILLMPVNLVVVIMNRLIIEKGRSREYHFLDAEDLRKILLHAGFVDFEVTSCYADQDWLVRARK